MKFAASALAFLSLVPAILGLTINTPTNVVQCQPVLLSWGAGTAPYFLSLIPPAQVAAPAFKTFPTQTGTSLTWTVDVATGTSFTIVLKDSTGTLAYSDIVTIQPGGDSSCLNSTSNVSAPPNTGTPVPTTSGTGNPSSNPSNTSPGSGGSSTKGTPTPSTSASGNTGGAIGLTLSSFGVAGVIGVIAVLF